MAGDLVHGGHITPTDENLLITPIEAMNSRPSSSSSSVSGIELLPEDATDSLQGLHRSSTSYLKHVSSRATVSAAGSWYLTPDSSVVSEGQKVDEGIPSSQGTSLSDNEEGSKGHLVNGEDNRAEAREIGMNEVTKESNDGHRPACTAGSNQDTDPVKPIVRNTMYDPCRVAWVDAIKAGRYSIFDEATADQGVGNVQLTEGDLVGDDNESEAGNEAGVGEVEDEGEDDVSFGDEDFPRRRAEFVDRGRFDPWTILNVLGNGDLDELRMLRLKEGFFRLFEQC